MTALFKVQRIALILFLIQFTSLSFTQSACAHTQYRGAIRDPGPGSGLFPPDSGGRSQPGELFCSLAGYWLDITYQGVTG